MRKPPPTTSQVPKAIITSTLRKTNMKKEAPTLEEILELADASNEFCVAFETYRLGHPDPKHDFVWNTLVQRKNLVWELLAKFGC
jgi:hypothetical protein